MAPTTGLPLSELRVVFISMEGDSQPQTHIIHHAEVDRFVAAIKQLHFEPGVNPHSGLTCTAGCAGSSPRIRRRRRWRCGASSARKASRWARARSTASSASKRQSSLRR